MLRQVRGLGTLVPVDEARRWIPAATQGRVERIVDSSRRDRHARHGGPRAQRSAAAAALSEAEQQLRAAEADFNSLEARLATDRLTQRSVAATVEAEYAGRQAATRK